MLEINYFGITLRNERVVVTENIVIGNGRMVLFLGDNASGKTLILNSIKGNFTKYEGEILIKEKPPLFYKKRKNSILLENAVHILPTQTVRNNILLSIENVKKRTLQKIEDLCILAGINRYFTEKAENLSYSQKNFIELIRAVIQLPHLILIDDLDNFFDEKNLDKAIKILEYAINNGSTVVATSKVKLEHFHDYYRIQNKKVVKL